MSWNFRAIGTPAQLVAALNDHAGTLSGDSLEEFEQARPHLQGLLRMNINPNYPSALLLDASGHASKSGGQVNYSACNVKIEGLGVKLL